MTRNVPISLKDPDAIVHNATLWRQLNELAGGKPDFTAVEIKSFYVIGLIKDIWMSVDCLLKSKDAWPQKYLPAFGVFASGVDLLGRCLTGNTTPDLNENLRVGFYYLANPTQTACPTSLPTRPEDIVVVSTSRTKYSIAALVDLRHYTTHGQATIRDQHLPDVDNDLLAQFPDKVGIAMDVYWNGLLTNAEYCVRMARAEIAPYRNRGMPLENILDHFEAGHSAGGLFSELDWHVTSR